MQIQEVEVTIDASGKVEIHVRGVKGDACLKITRPIEEALGNLVIQREMIPDAQQPPETAKKRLPRIRKG